MKKIKLLCLIVCMIKTDIAFSDGNYILIVSKNVSLCNYRLSNLNKSNNKHKSESGETLNQITWVDWRLGSYVIKGVDYTSKGNKVEVANLDIDNDLRLETVVREIKYVRDVGGEQLLVFDNNPPDFVNGTSLTIDEYNEFSGMLISPSWPYRLNEDDLPNKYRTDKYSRNLTLGLMKINPITIDNIVYLDIEEVLHLEGQPQWHILAKFTRDKFIISNRDHRETHRLEYICYFEKIDNTKH